jgi:hypothetical protein
MKAQPKLPTRSRRIAAQALSRVPASKRGEVGDDADGIARRIDETYHDRQERLRQYLRRLAQPLACRGNATALSGPTRRAAEAPCKPARLTTDDGYVA